MPPVPHVPHVQHDHVFALSTNQILGLWLCCCRFSSRSKSSLIGSLSKDNVDHSEKLIWRCNFVFLKSFLYCSKRLACQTCTIGSPGLKLVGAVWRWEEKLENCRQVLMSSKQQVISHRGQDENGSEMHKNEKCVQNYCFSFSLNMQICEIVYAVVVVIKRTCRACSTRRKCCFCSLNMEICNFLLLSPSLHSCCKPVSTS